jgi:sec-independent protein translocase protein TatA
MTPLLFGMGPMEMIPIIIIILLLFGGKKIPELMKGLGQGMKEFKDAKEGKSDNKELDNNSEKK